MSTGIHATRLQVVDVNRILTNTALLFENGKAVDFNEDWDDARVAEVVGCPESSVSNARRTDFGLKHPRYGKTPVAKKPSRIGAVEMRHQQLVDFVDKLGTQLDDMQLRINRLSNGQGQL